MKTDKYILELIDEYVRYSDISDISRMRYQANLMTYVDWLTRNVPDVRKATRADIIAYKKYLVDGPLADATIGSYLVAVRQFYRYMGEVGHCEDIAAGVRSVKRSPDIPKEYLTPDNVRLLLSSVDRSTIIGKRNYAIIYLMVTTGVRRIEVSRLNIGHLHQNSIMVQGKGRRSADRRVDIPEYLYNLLVQYIEEREASDVNEPLFVNHCYYTGRFTPDSVSKLIKSKLRSIGLDSPRLTAHSLRHTAAINALKAGCSVMQVRDMLGHRSVLTTDIYTRAIEAEAGRSNTPVSRLAELYKNK